MPLSEYSLSVNVSWAFERSLDGSLQPVRQGRDKRSFNLRGLDVAVFDEALVEDLVLSAGSSQTLDLFDFVNLISEATGLVESLTLVVIAEPSDEDFVDGAVLVTPGDTNPFSGFWNGTGAGAGNRIQSRGCLVVSAGPESGGTGGTAVPVSAAARNVKLHNPGPHDVNVFVAILGRGTP